MSIGRALLLVDGVVLGISIFVFGNVDAALFGMVTLFAQTKVIDSIIYGGRGQHHGDGGDQETGRDRAAG